MNREGHAGFSLILMSIFLYLMDLWNREWLTILALAIGFSMLPDLDIRFEIPHRKYTHTVVFAFVSGFAIGFIFDYSGMNFWTGFTGAFAGSLMHIAGDLLTHMPFAPLSPFCDKKDGSWIVQSRQHCSKQNNFDFWCGRILYSVSREPH